MLVFVEGGKPENPEKNPRSRDENQQQTQPTYDAGSGNRTRATLVGSERSHHCAIPAPPNTIIKRFSQVINLREIQLPRRDFTQQLSTCYSLEKTPDHPFFSRLHLNFSYIFQVWKISSQISRLFQEFKTLYEPCIYTKQHY